MRIAVRAAAVAVASFTLVAGPSFAWETSETPVTDRYSDHAAASLAGSELALNSVELPAPIAYDTDFSTPLDDHVEATVAEQLGTSEPIEIQVPRSLAELVA